MNIFVGNLSFDTTDTSLRSAFETHGAVDSAKVISDRMSGQSRGFGFVEMSDNSEAQAAMTALNNSTLDGRTITVNEARPREDRGGGGGGGGYDRGGGGGGYDRR